MVSANPVAAATGPPQEDSATSKANAVAQEGQDSGMSPSDSHAQNNGTAPHRGRGRGRGARTARGGARGAGSNRRQGGPNPTEDGSAPQDPTSNEASESPAPAAAAAPTSGHRRRQSTRAGPGNTQAQPTDRDDREVETAESLELRKRFPPEKLATLKSIFSDWKDQDLLFTLGEANGDLELAIGRISGGQATQWSSTSAKKIKKPVKPSGAAGDASVADGSALPSRGRGGLRGARGGLAGGLRGTARGARGAARGVPRNPSRLANGHAQPAQTSTAGLEEAPVEDWSNEPTASSSVAEWSTPTTSTPAQTPAAATLGPWAGWGKKREVVQPPPAQPEIQVPAEQPTELTQEALASKDAVESWSTPAGGATLLSRLMGSAAAPTGADAMLHKDAPKAPDSNVAVLDGEAGRDAGITPLPSPPKPSRVIQPGTTVSWAQIAKAQEIKKAAQAAAAPSSASRQAPVEPQVEQVNMHPQPSQPVSHDPWGNTPAAAAAATAHDPQSLGIGEAWADSVLASQPEPEHAAPASLPPPGINTAGKLAVDTPAAEAGAPLHKDVGVSASLGPDPSDLMGPPGLAARRTQNQRLKQDAPVVMPIERAVESVGVQFGSLGVHESEQQQPAQPAHVQPSYTAADPQLSAQQAQQAYYEQQYRQQQLQQAQQQQPQQQHYQQSQPGYTDKNVSQSGPGYQYGHPSGFSSGLHNSGYGAASLTAPSQASPSVNSPYASLVGDTYQQSSQPTQGTTPSPHVPAQQTGYGSYGQQAQQTHGYGNHQADYSHLYSGQDRQQQHGFSGYDAYGQPAYNRAHNEDQSKLGAPQNGYQAPGTPSAPQQHNGHASNDARQAPQSQQQPPQTQQQQQQQQQYQQSMMGYYPYYPYGQPAYSPAAYQGNPQAPNYPQHYGMQAPAPYYQMSGRPGQNYGQHGQHGQQNASYGQQNSGYGQRQTNQGGNYGSAPAQTGYGASPAAPSGPYASYSTGGYDNSGRASAGQPQQVATGLAGQDRSQDYTQAFKDFF
ncbi:uncharacterized protein L969DRAFT_88521 [Mixia osmundae IAM 14324]|uniref:RNA polymerase II degradation factor 1 n=1 Tax=Mixia osmundae (strain CBS 9802 / IAM 14324 / JCM 22182 / KY 12970) TaxID=764103 RepID=G7E6S2_MIXOS|nr:uncharacterized protein L969DRAFT_88521 [Mixia osmundae IAM 14324]KEI39085.1 hypothetical protein L969DRAFT_88521 [Mixia osmundae IAM 14324]GAA98532.1 hypothetical protein E5Q_05219 [Mixia osmundae IAM 14324]